MEMETRNFLFTISAMLLMTFIAPIARAAPGYDYAIIAEANSTGELCSLAINNQGEVAFMDVSLADNLTSVRLRRSDGSIETLFQTPYFLADDGTHLACGGQYEIGLNDASIISAPIRVYSGGVPVEDGYALIEPGLGLNEQGQIAIKLALRDLTNGGIAAYGMILATPRAGTEPVNPILPDPGDELPGGIGWRFRNGCQFTAKTIPVPLCFFDPPIAVGCQYRIDDSFITLFQAVLIHGGLGLQDTEFTVEVYGTNYPIVAGELFEFTEVTGVLALRSSASPGSMRMKYWTPIIPTHS